jgi:hypothetical protein
MMTDKKTLYQYHHWKKDDLLQGTFVFEVKKVWLSDEEMTLELLKYPKRTYVEKSP